ncbi:tetratricopeptide repeat protein [Opitutus sp. GAS368]|jgi:tetratricopeptide (TPR) repeat protein|uniref:tetratricopeptide repeat protein n=1 Tax=Opitutus sp. GAS368 TaxID=1882749 RepID=UPI00087D090F|nr:tetratricopeptide repeat protein [Opitutus sp. GAS368]SDR79424.1 Tetratricopeptide repeat-containing protein [Opitutus sp. GAS368]
MNISPKYLAILTLVAICGRAQIPTDLLQKTQEKYLRGDYMGAIVVLDRIIELHPNVGNGYALRGMAKEKNGDTIGALVDYAEAIRLQPTEANYYVMRGKLLAATDRHASAIRDFDKLIELQPAQSESYMYRGNARVHTRDYPGALADFNKALLFSPDKPEAYVWSVYTLRLMGSLSVALARADETIKLFPTHAEAYWQRSEVKVADTSNPSRVEAALTDLDEAIRLTPEDARYYKDRANLRSLSGDMDGAQADVNKYNELTRPKKR